MADKAVILAVDDTPSNLDVLREMLAADYTLLAATDGELALKIVHSKKPDLVLLDTLMPGIDGYQVCRRIKSDKSSSHIPVIFVAAMTDEQDESLGFAAGAVDYITKPLRAGIVHARVRAHLALADQQRQCQQQVEIATRDLIQNQHDAIEMLGDAGHYNDTDTGVHIWRMAEYSEILARAVNWSTELQQRIRLAAPMHDTGKIGIADEILKAPRKLSVEEFEIMKSHTTIGYEILRKSDTELFQMAAEIAWCHHEKWDGNGYPRGLKGEAIPESARIVAIADVFDALTMKRPYKEPWPVEKAIDLLRKNSASHFDPRLVEAFIAVVDEVLTARERWEPRDE
jgi:putative two-component system response regulator